MNRRLSLVLAAALVAALLAGCVPAESQPEAPSATPTPSASQSEVPSDTPTPSASPQPTEKATPETSPQAVPKTPPEPSVPQRPGEDKTVEIDGFSVDGKSVAGKGSSSYDYEKIYANARELYEDSIAIVTGEVSNVRFTDDNAMAITYYDFAIDEV